MTEWELLSRYSYFKLKDEDRRAFDRWQTSSAVTASLFALALLAMAVNAWVASAPAPTMMAEGQAASESLPIGDIAVRVGEDVPR